MGNPKAFLTVPRQEAGYRPIHDRIRDFGEVEQTLNTSERRLQASRCMDCGVPFCHWACPLGNRPPEFQDAIYRGNWHEAYEILSLTNDFRNSPDAYALPCARRAVCLNLPSTLLSPSAKTRAQLPIQHSAKDMWCRGSINATAKSGGSGQRSRRTGNSQPIEPPRLRRHRVRTPRGCWRAAPLRHSQFQAQQAIIDRRVDVMKAEGITLR